ncbi:MAG: hypothetical protein M3122_07630 [Actinomycetota bacterium]|nr:hypothetical protein [Actinomycetota bacterium]
MLDVDTFLTALYAIVDDFYKARPKEHRRPGPDASLSPSEVITLAIFARFSRFASERDFHRYANTNLRGAFPTLPDRSQFNRIVRSHARAAHRGGGLASGGEDDGGRERWMPLLRSPGQHGDGRPGRQAPRQARDGLRVTLTSDGPIGWGGTRDSDCSWP